jgi:hypothetical protein
MILTVDVGLRNLAFCIMDAETKTNLSSYSIHLWDVYNTLDSDDYKCSGIQKSGKVCGKKCSLKHINTLSLNTYNYTCKTHFPKNITIEKKHVFKKKMIDSYLLQDIADIVLLKIQDIYDSNILLFKQLKNVLIELQPKINQKAKFTSHIIYGKFVELFRNQNTIIRFVRASQKLKAYTGEEIECHLKGAYSRRKWLSVQYTSWFLENKFSESQRNTWLTVFSSKRVKPDMADTFLMAINAIHGVPIKTKFKHKTVNKITIKPKPKLKPKPKPKLKPKPKPKLKIKK